MSRTARIISALVVVGALGAGWWWWTHRTSTTTAARVELVRVRRGSLEAAADASGALLPDEEQSVSFPIGGRIAVVSATLGQTVTLGQALAALDTADLRVQEATARANLRTAQSSLASARTKLAMLSAGPDPVDLEVAKLNLDKARDARWGVQSQRDAVCGRFKAGRAQETDCNQAQASVQQAEISVRIAELQYDDLKNGSDPDTLADARDAVARAEASRDIAQSSLDQATLKIGQATLTSPITGTVTSLTAKVGEQAAAGQAVVTVSDLSRFRIEVSLDETEVSRLRVGQAVRATVGAVPDAALTGQVVSIAPAAVPQSGVVLYPVVLRLEPTDADLRAGMTADVQIVTASESDVIVLPLRAIETEGGKHFVEVLDAFTGAAAGTAVSGASSGAGANGARTGGTPRSRSGTTGTPRAGTTGRANGAAGQALTEDDVTTRRVEVTLGTQTDSQAVILAGLSVGDTVVVKSASAKAVATSSRPGGFGPGPIFGGPGRQP